MRSFNQSLLRAACVASASVLVPASANSDDSVAKGRALAERLCATCHMGPGQGEKTAPSEIPGFYAVARRPGQSVAAVMDWLRSVPPMMPNHHLSQDEMADLAQFIMSLRNEPP